MTNPVQTNSLLFAGFIPGRSSAFEMGAGNFCAQNVCLC